jgi:hypothetical protein
MNVHLVTPINNNRMELTMLTFKEAQETFDTARDKSKGKPLGNNTRLVRYGNGYAVFLHQTAVVVIKPDGTYRLNSGGWRTVTTKDRINLYSPASLFQSKGIWYLSRQPDSSRCIFTDGMVVDSNGFVVAHCEPEKKQSAWTDTEILDQLVSEFPGLVEGSDEEVNGGDLVDALCALMLNRRKGDK